MSDFFKLTIDKDKINAFLNVLPECDLEEMSLQDVLEFLNGKGVVFGIDEEAISKMIEEQKWDENVKVAQGREAVKGKDGFVKYLFETEKKSVPKVNEDGSVDHHDLTLVENVVPDQELARMTPPTEGEPGENVFGKPILTSKGNAVQLIAGKNTAYADEEKTIVLATVTGHAILKRDSAVEVDTIYTVKNDVDYSTGDIQVNGDVCVRGDVKAGFEVKATGNVEVRKLVEDAKIIAGGNVKVVGGFVGHGKGLIKCKGEANIGFIHNQHVIADGDVRIDQSAVQAEIIAGGSLAMNRGKGTLIGGTTRVTKHAEIDEIGNDQHVKTILIVGHTEKLEASVKQLEEDIEQCIEYLSNVKKKIALLAGLKQQTKWTKEIETLYKKLEKLLVQLPSRKKQLMGKKIAITKKIEEIQSKSYIKISKRIHPGVSFKVAGFSRKFEKEWSSSTFRVVDGELISVYD